MWLGQGWGPAGAASGRERRRHAGSFDPSAGAAGASGSAPRSGTGGDAGSGGSGASDGFGGVAGVAGAAGAPSFGGAAGAPSFDFPGGPCPEDLELEDATYEPAEQTSGGSVKVVLKIVKGAPTSACTVQYWLNCQINESNPTWHTLSLVGNQFEGMVPVDCSGEPAASACSFSYYYNYASGVTHSGGGYPGASCAP